MKTFWYATLVTLTSLVLGGLVSQSFGADQKFSRSLGAGVSRSAGQVRQASSSGRNLHTGVPRNVGGSQGMGGFKPPIRTVSPITKPVFPIGKPPVVKPTLPPIVKPPVGPVRPFPPIVKPPVVGPPKPLPPIVKPPVVGPPRPLPPIVKPPIGPPRPLPPIVTPLPPIAPPLPPKPLPPICPPPCPPKPCPPICPPICPPGNPGHCGPWYPLPGWFGCYKPCPPICVTLPTYVGTPVVVSETVVVEAAAPAVAITEVKSEAEAKLTQVPVGATLTLNEKTLGDKQGQVVLQVDPLSVPAQVNEWKADQVNVTLPMFGLSAPTKAQIWLLRADGQVANMLAVELIPAKPQANAGEAQASTASAAIVTQN